MKVTHVDAIRVTTEYRTRETTCDDGLLPVEGMFSSPVGTDQRCEAIAVVLCRIPPDDYQALKQRFSDFQWFIPPCWPLGAVLPFPAQIYPEKEADRVLQLCPYAPVVYLSPALEKSSRDIVVSVVAHELAHIVLGHDLNRRLTGDEYQAQEEAVFGRICEWGFQREATKHRAFCKRRDTLIAGANASQG